ncbi:putative outer membrane lipoprotein [Stenotrophomonas phage Sonora]|nr:putative outer membrane lipoprotein [Stenotrophomonas phage Sonora]
MNRFKMFIFYQLMAFTSLIVPKAGQDMIDCAEKGAEGKLRERRMEAIRGLAQTEERPGVSDE